MAAAVVVPVTFSNEKAHDLKRHVIDYEAALA